MGAVKWVLWLIPCSQHVLLEVHAAQPPLPPLPHAGLERQLPRDLPLAPDLGIPLGLMGLERYEVPPGPPAPLDPEDRALLGVSGTPGQGRGALAPCLCVGRGRVLRWL